jgi:predicted dehydrogenase
MGSSSSPPFRVAILGAGVISSAHVAAVRKAPNAKLTAVCDLDEAKTIEFQKIHGPVDAFQNLEAMLERAKPDVVHILLPPDLHARISGACLARGAGVFVEKPYCVSSAECAELDRIAANTGAKIGVNHNLTFMPGLLRVVDMIRECRFGAVQHVTINFNLGLQRLAAGPHRHWMFGTTGNLVFELGPHPLSVIYQLVGGLLDTRVLTTGDLKLTNGVDFHSSWQCALSCERGTAQLLLSVGKAYTNAWIHILGEDAEAFVDLRRCTVRVSERTHYMRVDDLVDGTRNAASLLRQSLANFREFSLASVGLRPQFSWQQDSIDNSVSAFYKALGSGAKIPVGAPEGSGVVRMCEAIVASAQASRETAQHLEVLARG